MTGGAERDLPLLLVFPFCSRRTLSRRSTMEQSAQTARIVLRAEGLGTSASPVLPASGAAGGVAAVDATSCAAVTGCISSACSTLMPARLCAASSSGVRKQSAWNIRKQPGQCFMASGPGAPLQRPQGKAAWWGDGEGGDGSV